MMKHYSSHESLSLSQTSRAVAYQEPRGDYRGLHILWNIISACCLHSLQKFEDALRFMNHPLFQALMKGVLGRLCPSHNGGG